MKILSVATPLKLLLIVALPFSFQSQGHPQEIRTPIVIGEGIRQYSEVMNEDRVIILGTPRGYERTDDRYPVLYILDGGMHFQHTTAITEFLAANLYMPQMIVVGINSPDRVRDLTLLSENPIEIERYPTHGGSELFLRYIKEELMPWVNSNYRTHPYNILVGHSFGGLFTIQSLISDHDLFDAYIAISPSMHWSNQALVDESAKFFESIESLRSTFYMSAGNEGRESLAGIRRLSAVLDETYLQGFSWKFEHMPIESHGSVSLKSIYNGLEFVFKQWSLRNPYEVYDSLGIDAIDYFHNSGNQRYGYNRSLPITTFAALLGEAIYRRNLHGAIEIMDRYYSSVSPPVSYLELLAEELKDEVYRESAIRYYREILARDPDNSGAMQTLIEWGVN
jgi:predicted alpha/beta superfamily hydrolase